MRVPNELIQIGGVLHIGLLTASALLPRELNWRQELRRVSDLSRHVIWVHGAFVVLTIIAFGVISLTLANDLTAQTPLGRAVCGFIAIFWATRLVIQFTVFDARPYLTKPHLKIGYHGLTVCFAYFTTIYGWVAFG